MQVEQAVEVTCDVPPIEVPPMPRYIAVYLYLNSGSYYWLASGLAKTAEDASKLVAHAHSPELTRVFELPEKAVTP